MFEPDGWFHTGDIGRDRRGRLPPHHRPQEGPHQDRGRENIAPQNIENLLKGDPFVSQALVDGDRRPYPVALITLNPDELAKFAREQGSSATSPPPSWSGIRRSMERVRRTVEA